MKRTMGISKKWFSLKRGKDDENAIKSVPFDNTPKKLFT